MRITDRGLAFSFDLLAAFLIMGFMLHLIMLNYAGISDSIESRLKRIELEKNAVFATDSFVKNSDENNPAAGAAFYNSGLHRVQSNLLDPALLEKIDGNSHVF